jgi:hypothetical protein
VVGRLQINEDNRDYLAGKAIACAKDISRLLGWKSPSNNSPHHKENIMTLPKIKHVRAWFIGGATAEQAPAAAITTTRGLTTGLTIISPPR